MQRVRGLFISPQPSPAFCPIVSLATRGRWVLRSLKMIQLHIAHMLRGNEPDRPMGTGVKYSNCP